MRTSKSSQFNLPDVDLRQLYYAIAVAYHRSFRRAAQTLGVQQSAVSRRIRNLEDQIGVSLFERDNSGVRLTSAGTQFLQQVKDILRQLDHTIAGAGRSGRGDNVRISIGCGRPFRSMCIQGILAQLSDRLPAMRVALMEGATRDLTSAVFDHQLDIVFMLADVHPPGLDTLVLWRDRPCVAVSERRPLASAEVFPIEMLRRERIHVSRSDDWSDVHRIVNSCIGPNLDVVFHVCSREAILCLVAAGEGVALVSRFMTAATYQNIRFLPSEGTASSLVETAAWHPQTDNPALRRLLSILREGGCRCARVDGSHPC